MPKAFPEELLALMTLPHPRGRLVSSRPAPLHHMLGAGAASAKAFLPPRGRHTRACLPGGQANPPLL
jgi:hypothetical protein